MRIVRNWEAHHFLSFDCPFCGKDNLDTDGLCEKCGATLVLYAKVKT